MFCIIEKIKCDFRGDLDKHDEYILHQEGWMKRANFNFLRSKMKLANFNFLRSKIGIKIVSDIGQFGCFISVFTILGYIVQTNTEEVNLPHIY